MWVELQYIHPKTLRCSFILAGNSKNFELKFAELVLKFSEQGDRDTLFHLKIKAWHQNNKTANGVKPGYPCMEDTV